MHSISLSPPPKPNMSPSEIQEMSYSTHQNPLIFHSDFGLVQNDSLFNFPNYPTSLLLGNSTSDEADDQHVSIVDERKQRRMISNRESARRSRMRKQRHLDELWSQVVRLRTDNHSLIDKLSQVSESHEKAVEENTRLKKETSELRRMVMDLQAFSIFRDLDDISCNAAHLRAESSDQSVTTFLH